MMKKFFYHKRQQKIGIYHFKDDILSIGKIIKIVKNHLFMESYDTNNVKDGIKIFSIDKIKRIILKSDYIEKLENIKKINQFFDFFNVKMTSFEDACKEIIKKQYLILLNLGDDSTELGYLFKKEGGYYYFRIVNKELKEISTEIFTEDYIKEIKIITNEKNIQNKPLNKIELYSGKVYRGNLLFNKEKIVIFKEIIEFSEENHVLILRKENIREITEIYKEEKIKYKNIKKLKLLDENYHFVEKLKIKSSEIDILRIKNYSLNTN